MDFWNQKTFCLVTGASRGIGRTISVEFSKNVAPGSVFLLMARSTSGLQEVKEEILKSSGGQVSVVLATVDLENPDNDLYINSVKGALAEANKSVSDFDHALLVHNAGSLGIEKQLKVSEMEDLSELQSYFSLNVFSMIILTTQFFKLFNNPEMQRSIVQITSLSALKPCKSWGLYCTGKAARDMLMKLVAEESDIQVLNWAPGPVKTEMLDKVCKNTGDPELSKMMNDCKDGGHALTCEQTVGKLVKVLAQKKYVKGEHVDYFDVE